jgi:colanic acid biosynthesis glycosyl transferase WcaI
MRILLIANQFPPDVNSTGNLMAELAARWCEQGHEVFVVTTFPHYENFRIDAAQRRKLYQRGKLGAINIMRLWVYAPGKKSMFNRLINYLSFAVGATLAGLLQARRSDVILCTNGGFFSGIAAWLIGAFKQSPFIYNVQDLYPEVPIAAGQLRNRYAIEMLKRIEAFMYRKARHVSVISAAMRDNLLGKQVAAEKISLLPNFVNCEFIRPLPRNNEFSRGHGLDDKFVVLHAGNLGYVYDFESLVASAKALQRHPEIVFLIVGEGVAKAALQERAKTLGLANVRFLPFQPHAQLPWLRASADVQVSLYKAGAARHSMPSKIYEIMASGRPLLASAEKDSPVSQLVDETGCGICVEPEQAEPLTQAIINLYGDVARREKFAAQGRRAAQESYSLNAVADGYQKLMQQMVDADVAPARLVEPLSGEGSHG